MKKKRMIFSLLLLVAVCVGIATAQDSGAALQDNMTFNSLMRAGGVVMLVIAVLSTCVVALAIICFLLMRRRRFVPKGLKHVLYDHIINGRFKTAQEICRDNQNVPLCRILGPGLKKSEPLVYAKGNTPEPIEVVFLVENIKKAMESVGLREFDGVRSVIEWFSNIGVIAPMLGLLGTVIGMIKAFGAIAYKVETGKPVLLSSAISQAMVTTAGGLVVGIFSMLLFYYFAAKLEQIIGVVEGTAEDLIDEIEVQIRKKRKA